MLVSYKWLQDYVNLSDVTPEELAEKITKSGIEVEGIHRQGEKISNLVVGQVLQCEQHPNAEKLSICQVDIGENEPVQIVCGAPNVAAGQKVIVAKPGAILPNNMKIKKSKLRGEESNGMICSLQELGFEGKVVPKEFADGIYVLPDDVKVGTDVIQLFDLDDSILELGLTPNRSDCLSMVGVAYETAAILNQQVNLPEVTYESTTEKASDYIEVKVEAPEDNPLYVAKIIKNVKIGPSPLWMQKRLMSAGIRPHNNIVDITNYILLEYGQPLHAFDYDRFGSKEVVVRRARQGEKLVTLDGVTRILTEDHLVITNGKVPVALAGVMGGEDSEVNQETTTVLLESAYFNGAVIRKAAKDHQLRSEASIRFEKGVDPNRVRLAAERAAALMEKYAGGEVLEGIVEVDTLTIQPVTITIELEKVNQFLGTNLSIAEVKNIFDRLQFNYVVENETFIITVPSRRLDIQRKEDLYEEIARLYGYDRLPKTLPEGPQTPGGLTPYQKKRRVIRYLLEGIGLSEVITYSLTSQEKFDHFALTKTEKIQLAMPMSEEHAILRSSLIPHLLDVVSYNRARKNIDLALFEIGSVFLSRGVDQQPKEREHLAGALTGLWVNHPWQGEKVKVDFFTVKGIVEQILHKLGIQHLIRYEKGKEDGLHPGQTAHIYLNDEYIGFIGKIHPSIEKEYDIKDVFVFELNAESLFNVETRPVTFTQIPRYPAITRDLAIIADRHQSAFELEKIIYEAGGTLLADVKVFDVYEGERIDADKKSIAFSLTFLDPNRTLTDEEIEAAQEKILQALMKKGAQLRK